MPQGGFNFVGGETFGIDQFVYAHFKEIRLVFGFEKLIVVDSGHCFACAQFFCKRAGHDVACLVWRDGNEKIAFADRSLFQHFERGGVAGDGHEVVVGIDRKQFRLVGIDENDVEAFVGL